MKIIFENTDYSILGCMAVLSLDICIRRLESKEKLDDSDYDMILSHLKYYKDLLEEAEINGNNN